MRKMHEREAAELEEFKYVMNVNNNDTDVNENDANYAGCKSRKCKSNANDAAVSRLRQLRGKSRAHASHAAPAASARVKGTVGPYSESFRAD